VGKNERKNDKSKYNQSNIPREEFEHAGILDSTGPRIAEFTAVGLVMRFVAPEQLQRVDLCKMQQTSISNQRSRDKPQEKQTLA
jgi:hypothetical protein